MPAVTRPKIIVLDDDPTGSQTVHSCLLLSRWDVDTLCRGLTDPVPIFFILTNTRALPAEIAAEVTRTVCCHLKAAIAQTGTTDYMVVSRSDSTLRGHYPLETDVIAAELGPFDAHFLVPAFLEGGALPVIASTICWLQVSRCPSMKRSLPAIPSLAITTATYPTMWPKRPKGASPPQP